MAPRGPVPPAAPALPAAPPPTPLPTSAAPTTPAAPLVSLERPFSVDDFAGQLGATLLEVVVPRDDLAEVLKRVCDFMGFGIYVYDVRVRPAPHELLKGFVVTLQRVDFRAERGAWIAFEERGRSDSPFGPEGHR